MRFKRILLKLSGESLAGEKKQGIDETCLLDFASQVKKIADYGIQIGIVIGGGNIFRGLSGENKGFDRVKGDQMGMLSTVINSLALQNALETLNAETNIFTSFSIESIGERISKQVVTKALDEGKICIMAGGTGNPYFSTDSASALRAIEIEADVFLKGTRVDGVYSADPEKFPDATKYDKLTFSEVYEKNLKVMDLTAFTLCQENNMPIIVFNMDKSGNLEKIVTETNTDIGTIITN
ncbi:UMP kinase [Bacteroidales bacterium OttesenSCG-928-I21]|nr:UMP kinase [Bacteroidales bacterium OttesenSCG-928-I21]